MNKLKRSFHRAKSCSKGLIVMHYCYRLWFVFFLLFGVGCATQQHTITRLSYVEQTYPCLIKNLQQAGVQTIMIGDELRLILPARYFFAGNVDSVTVSSHPVLDSIIDLLNEHKNTGVQVLACVFSSADLTFDRLLAQRQAQAVVDYFWRHGLNARIVVPKVWCGVTRKQLIGSGSFVDDPPRFYSVEIRTRWLHPEEFE